MYIVIRSPSNAHDFCDISQSSRTDHCLSCEAFCCSCEEGFALEAQLSSARGIPTTATAYRAWILSSRGRVHKDCPGELPPTICRRALRILSNFKHRWGVHRTGLEPASVPTLLKPPDLRLHVMFRCSHTSRISLPLYAQLLTA